MINYCRSFYNHPKIKNLSESPLESLGMIVLILIQLFVGVFDACYQSTTLAELLRIKCK